MSESTDRLSINADQLVPRVIKRGKLISSGSIFGPGDYWQANDTSITISDLDTSVNSWIEVWVEVSGKLYELPSSTVHASSGQVDISGGVGVSRIAGPSGNRNFIQFNIFRNTDYGSTSDAYTFYYIIYSTKVTEERLV